MQSSITISLVDEARGGPFVFWNDLPEAVRHAALLGFDAIELFPPAPDTVSGAQLRSMLSDHSLQLSAVGTGAGWLKHRFSLTDESAECRQAAAEFIADMIHFAGPLGAPVIIGSMQGRAAPPQDRPTAIGRLRHALDFLGPIAAQHDVPLLYEPLNRYETQLCNSLHEACELLDSLTTDNVKVLADLFHMNIEEADLSQAILRANGRIGHVHWVDSNRCAVGMGHLSIAPVMDSLREIGYGGYLSAEALPIPDSLTAAQQTIRMFRHWTALRH